MKFQRIIDALYHQPLAISLAGFETLDRLARPVIFEGKRAEKDFFGGDLPKMEIGAGLAVIPVTGPLIQHASLLDKQCGATSYDDIRADLEVAADKRVRACVLNFDSPGGQSIGCLELAEFIADYQEEAGIPVYAFTDTVMCSAAYFLAAGCAGVFAARSALTGSIGTIIGFVDESKAYEEAGLKAVFFASGKYKATGREGTSLSQEQSEYLQDLVDAAFAQFAAHVGTHRPDVALESMEGQCFWGEQAAELGLVDYTVDTIGDVIEFLEG